MLEIVFVCVCLLVLLYMNSPTWGQMQPTTNTVTILSGSSNPSQPVSYSPSILTTQAGQTVIWFNGDSVYHTVTSISQTFDSGIIIPGKDFSWTFNDASYNKYYCQIHPFMSGAIIVN